MTIHLIKSTTTKLCLGLLFFLVCSSVGHSKTIDSFFVSPAILYQSKEITEVSSSNTETNSEDITSLNISFAYGLGNGFSFGVKYLNETSNNSSQLFSSDPNGDQSDAIGVLVGYNLDELLLAFSYMALQAPNLVSGNDQYKGGSGYMIDVGYLIDMGGWSVGPQITKRIFEYKTHFTNGSRDTDFTSLKVESLDPYLAFLVII